MTSYSIVQCSYASQDLGIYTALLLKVYRESLLILKSLHTGCKSPTATFLRMDEWIWSAVLCSILRIQYSTLFYHRKAQTKSVSPKMNRHNGHIQACTYYIFPPYSFLPHHLNLRFFTFIQVIFGLSVLGFF